MGLSDCIECWQTPCECGYEYSCWSIQRKVEQIKTIMGKDEKEILEKLNQKEETPLCTPDIGERGGAIQDGKNLNPKQFESVIYQIPSKPKQRR